MESVCAIKWHQWWKKTATKENCETEVKIWMKDNESSASERISELHKRNEGDQRLPLPMLPASAMQVSRVTAYRIWPRRMLRVWYVFPSTSWMMQSNPWISRNRLLSKPITFFVHHSSARSERESSASYLRTLFWMISRFWRMQMSCGNGMADWRESFRLETGISLWFIHLVGCRVEVALTWQLPNRRQGFFCKKYTQ